MKYSPNTQINLYGHDLTFQNIIGSFESKKLPNKVLLSGPKGLGKATLAYHFINYIFSKNEEHPYQVKTNTINNENKSYKQIINKTHQNFHLIDLIDDKKNIEISQIREMIDYTNKSSFNNQPRIILIDNLENLNLNSTNALLKIIEEPNDNVFFILIHNSNKKIAETLKSRCITYKINFTFTDTLNITNRIIKDDISALINQDLISHYNTPGFFIEFLDFSKTQKIDLKNISLNDFLSFLIEKNHYKKDMFIKNNIFNFIELYYLKIFNTSDDKTRFITYYNKFIKKIYNTKKFNLDIESLFMEFKSKILNV